MDIQELLKCAEAYRGLLDRLALIKEDMADLEQITKERAVLTNMELRAFKRILKAESKDQLDKLDEQTEAQQYLRDVLTDKKVVDKKIVAIEHDPETGEVISLAPDRNSDGAPVVDNPRTPTENAEGRDRFSDIRTSDEIIGDMPQICRRA